MADEISKDIDTLKSEMSQLRNDLSSIGHTVRDLATHSGGSFSERAQETAGRGRELVTQAGERFKHQVEAHPLVSILIAFSVGLFAGLLAQRRL